MKIPDKYNDKVKKLNKELQGKFIQPENLIKVILLALEIYESERDSS